MLEIYCISKYVMAMGQFCEIIEDRFLRGGLRSEVEREGENQSSEREELMKLVTKMPLVFNHLNFKWQEINFLTIIKASCFIFLKRNKIQAK
jgi:ABC-type histidine transport system ATPase subunit